MRCAGLADDHCCWVAGDWCLFLEENTVEGRRWACGLRRELGSWDAVHVDPRYRSQVRSRLPETIPDCGDWPPAGVTCESCGVVGG